MHFFRHKEDATGFGDNAAIVDFYAVINNFAAAR